MFLATNPRVKEYQAKIDHANERLKEASHQYLQYGGVETAHSGNVEIADPVSGTRNWTDVRQFNLMFATEMGSVAEDANTIYLRPETAQGIFVNFLNVQNRADENSFRYRADRQSIPQRRSSPGNSFSACANSSKWKCNSS